MSNKKILLSLCIPIWGNLHLLKRSIETYVTQDFPHESYELIFFDDNSPDNPEEFVRDFMKDKDVEYTYIKCVHPHGWRGCSVAFNTMFQMARGEIIAETTAETMLQPNVVRLMYEPHLTNERCFVTFRTYNLRPEVQVEIDSVDWKADLYNIKNIDGFNDPHTLRNEATTNFVTHQTCSIKKKVFWETMPQGGYPLAGDYGFDDPFQANMKETKNVPVITMLEPLPIHQWHPPIGWHFAHNIHAPHLNYNAHTTWNYMQDTTGAIPEGGTCTLWDGGSHDKMSEEEKQGTRTLFDKWVKATGGYFYDD